MSMSSSSSSPSVITCKALVCRGPDQWKVEDIEVDPPLASEVRIRMLYASICHSDLLCSRGIPLPLYPRVLGHEGVGVVESVGEKVKDLKEGDVVMPSTIGECGECENCASGKTNVCLTHPLPLTGLMPDGSARLHLPAPGPAGGGGGWRQPLYHVASCSTWSQYIVSDANYLVKLQVHPDLPLPHASFLSCGFATGFGAAQVEARIEKGSSVAVLGLGAVGLGAVAGAKVQGAATIVGVDKNDMKREKGEAFGVTHFINPGHFPTKSISELIKDLTGGLGVDYCIECTGAAPLINQALDSTKVGKGKVIVVGVGPDASVSINFLPLVMGRTLKGTIFGGIKPRSHLPLLLDRCKKKEIPLDELLTHEIQLEDVAQALELVKRQDCVKILIKIYTQIPTDRNNCSLLLE